MEKSSANREKKRPLSSSPLVSSTISGTDEEKKNLERTKKSSKKKSRRQAAKELQEEARLTAALFGGNSDSAIDDPDSSAKLKKSKDKKLKEARNFQETGDEAIGGLVGFEIDRVGVLGEKEEIHVDRKAMVQRDNVPKDDSESDDSDDDEESKESKEENAPAWVDEDDEKLELDLYGPNSTRFRKLRKSSAEEAAKSLTGSEVQHRLRQHYKDTAQTSAITDWANIDKKLKDDSDGEKEDDIESDFKSSSAPLLASSYHGKRLPPGIVSISRCKDANHSDPNQAVVRAVHFHPGSNPDRPLLLTGGLDKTLRFFQVGVDDSEKVHGVHFPDFPIFSASFLGTSGKVVVSSRRSHFYFYDAASGKLDLVHRIMGREEKSWEYSVASPSGRMVAFKGNDGYVVVMDAHTKSHMVDFKLNGSVSCITFTPDSQELLASGSDGDVYRFDMRSRKCLERFSNQDGTITSSLAASSKHLAVGAASGVVNLYSEHHSLSGKKGGLSLLQTQRDPIKSIMNLKTSADILRFNSDGQILAMASRLEKDSLKLLHVPTATVFSNWPTSKTPLKEVWTMDFSPESKFFAIGNDRGHCRLYQLKHYD